MAYGCFAWISSRPLYLIVAPTMLATASIASVPSSAPTSAAPTGRMAVNAFRRLRRTGSSKEHGLITVERSRANYLADKINTIGITSYSDSFEGVLPVGSSTLAVYVTPHSRTLRQAIHRLRLGNIGIRWHFVRHSYAQLEDLTYKIAHNNGVLAREGINLQSWAPDPASDSVRVTLAPSTQKSGFAAYISRSRTFLQRKFGTGWITLANGVAR